MTVIKPLDDIFDETFEKCKIFLGGSIEQGEAIDWQTWLTKEIDSDKVLIMNPRRDEWDSSWKQDPKPGSKFYEQVCWELEGQDEADLIVYYFDEKTKSPITLMELGLYAKEKNKIIIVYCNEKFWRYGNVKIVCDRLSIPCFEDKQKFLNRVKLIVDMF